MVSTQRIIEREIDKVRRMLEMQELREHHLSEKRLSEQSRPIQHLIVPSPNMAHQVKPISTKKLLEAPPPLLSREENSQYHRASNQTKVTKKKSQSSE